MRGFSAASVNTFLELPNLNPPTTCRHHSPPDIITTTTTSHPPVATSLQLSLAGTTGISGRDVNELIAQCHPLGLFKESTMRLCTTFDNSPKGYSDLYQVKVPTTCQGKGGVTVG